MRIGLSVCTSVSIKHSACRPSQQRDAIFSSTEADHPLNSSRNNASYLAQRSHCGDSHHYLRESCTTTTSSRGMTSLFDVGMFELILSQYVRHLLARSEQESQAKQVEATTQNHQFGPIMQCAPTGACQVLGGGGFLPAPQPFFPFPFYNPNVFFDPNGVRFLPGPNVVPCPNGQPGICATG